jgi:hypothetical protein
MIDDLKLSSNKETFKIIILMVILKSIIYYFFTIDCLIIVRVLSLCPCVALVDILCSSNRYRLPPMTRGFGHLLDVFKWRAFTSNLTPALVGALSVPFSTAPYYSLIIPTYVRNLDSHILNKAIFSEI